MGLMDNMGGDLSTADIIALLRASQMPQQPPPDWRSNMDAPAPGYDQRTGAMDGQRPQAMMTEAGPYAAARPMSERVGNAIADYGPLPAKIATEIAMQPVRAGSAAGLAVADPTLANITDAGVQTAIAAFRPLAAAKMLGAGYGAAAARDAGAFNIGARAEDDGLTGAQRQRLEALQKKQQRNTLTRAEREEQNSYLSIQAAAQSAKATAAATADGERRKLEAEADAKRKASELAEYERSVGVAEKARDAELGRANRFSDSEVGKVYAKTGIITPALAAAGAGGLARAALGAKAGHAPLVAGLGTGAATAHYPLAHDAMLTPAYNPDRAAYEAYARELPPTHPRKAEWLEYARGLPQENPTRDAASKELYNPMKFGERTVIGLLEGLVSGPAGAHAVEIASRAPRSLARTSAEATGNVIRGAGAAPGLMAEAGYLQGAKTQAARGQYERSLADADSMRQVAGSSPRPSGPGGLLDDVGSTPISPLPATSAPRPQPQPAPSQSPLLPPPSSMDRVKDGSDWQLYHSQPARAAVEAHLKSGAPLTALTEPKLRELMAPMLGKGVEPPARSTLRQYLQGLKDDAGESIKTSADAKKFFKKNPGAFSVMGPAIGAGAAGLGLMNFADE